MTRGRTKNMYCFRRALYTLLLGFVCVGPVFVVGQGDGSSPTEGQVTDGGGDPQRPIDAAMAPLYTMTNTFLALLQPKNKGNILEKTGMVDEVADGDYLTVVKSMEDWETWVVHYIGFVVCAAVGALFVIVMPIVGFCFCCCRCCGRCGARASKEEKRGDRCRRITCGTFLALFNTVILAGMVCAFVTNELLREQTARQENSLLSSVKTELDQVESFTKSTIQEFKTVVLGGFNGTSADIIARLESAPLEARRNLSSSTRSELLLTDASDLAQAAVRINTSLTQVDKTTTDLRRDGQQLTEDLRKVKQDLQTTLDQCGTTECAELKTSLVNPLDSGADFSRVDNVTDELNNVREILQRNLESLIQQGENDFEQITERLQNKTQGQIDESFSQYLSRVIVDVRQKLDEAAAQIRDVLNDVTRSLDEYNMEPLKDEITSFQPTVEEYGNYRYYAGIALCCVLLLVVLFYYLGLCFGACGEPPGEDSPACNRGVGGSILMAGVAFAFLFGWLLMVICLVLFLVGGVSQTEVCRYAIDLPTAPQSMKQIIDTQISQAIGFAEADNFRVTNILSECQLNKAIYVALNLESRVNLTEYLDIDRYDIKAQLDELANSVDLDLSDVTILSPDAREQLENLENAGFNSIDIQSFKDQLSKDVITVNLTAMISQLRAIAEDVRSPRPQLATSLDARVAELTHIQRDLVVPMQQNANTLSTQLSAFEAEVVGPPSIETRIGQLITDLMAAQAQIQADGSVLVKKFVRGLADGIYGDLDGSITSMARKIKTEVGQCLPLYRSVDNVLDHTCITLLDPFNGFWFSLGCCLFFLIPCIIMSVALVSLYRKTDEFYDDKSFDDVINRRKKSRVPGSSAAEVRSGVNGQGLPNAAYEGGQGDYPGHSYGPYRAYPSTGRDYPSAGRDYPSAARDYPSATREYSSGGRGGYPSGSGYAAGPSPTPSSNPPHYYNNRPRIY